MWIARGGSHAGLYLNLDRVDQFFADGSNVIFETIPAHGEVDDDNGVIRVIDTFESPEHARGYVQRVRNELSKRGWML